MAASYSIDLRARVMQDIGKGMSAEDAAAKYSITARTIYDWKRLLLQTGDLKPRAGHVGRKRKLDAYHDAIQRAVAEDSSTTLEELHSKLNLPGTVTTLWNALKRWGLSLKKSDSRR